MSKELSNILKTISQKFDIPEDELENISKEHCKIHLKSGICIARKQDGDQCTRKSKEGSVFCGKHIVNQKYGCVNDELVIELTTIFIDDVLYYMDPHCILYLKENDIEGNVKYKPVGKKGTQKNYFIDK